MILGIGVIWLGYTLAWWGWLGMTDQVHKGGADTIWWPSIMDLIVPGKAGNLSNTVRQTDKAQAQSSAAIQAAGNQPLTGVPANPYDPSVNPIMPASFGSAGKGPIVA